MDLARVILPQTKERGYRDPCAFYKDGVYYLYYSLVQNEADGQYFYVAESQSRDLKNWSEPQLIRVKGESVKREDMGRMIDPYILRDGDRFVCFFKQNGVSFSESKDLEHWSFLGSTDCGENVSVFRRDGYYYILHSPANGIGLLRSRDLNSFEDLGTSLLGQENYLWAKDRITAAFLLEKEGGDILFFHGDEESDYLFGASIAVIENWRMEDYFEGLF